LVLHATSAHGNHRLAIINGRLYAEGDTLQAPAAGGTPLVITRILPSLFRDSRVHRVAVFFRALRQTLVSIASWAPNQVECRLAIDWKALGLDPQKAISYALRIYCASSIILKNSIKANGLLA
jgi:hypothetical protein